MGIEMIGQNVARLRKEQGILQEALASAVGVSAQAVSKWENGGTPDTELLPAIADFFNVSIDSLFGRLGGDVSSAIRAKMETVPWEKKIQSMFEICLDVQRAFFGDNPEKMFPREAHTEFLMNDGTTFACLDERMPFFMVTLDAKERHEYLFDGVDYASFFAAVGKKEVFNAIVFVLTRPDMHKQFTVKLLMRELGMSEEFARDAVLVMKKYDIVNSSFAEIDDETVELFCIKQENPTFMLLLTIAHEVIKTPNCWYYMSASRNKNWLA